MTMLDRQPTREQLDQVYLGPCDIDDVTWQQVGNRTVKRCARRGSQAAREAHVTTPHPTNPSKVICWLFLALTVVACPGSMLLALKAVAAGVA